MSRIGKMPITLDDKVKAVVQGDKVNFEGPKGKLSVTLPIKDIKVEATYLGGRRIYRRQ